jgi:asparagine synthase (glutamine-hydrolysing)
MMKHVKSPVRTFTVGFEETSFDESGYAAAVAASLGTVHTCEMLAANDLMALMPTFVKQYDEPFFDYSAFPVMAVSRLARQSVTVSLSGDGGDEAFGGYHYYRIMQGLERAQHMPAALRRIAGASLQRAPVQRLRWLGEILAMQSPTSAYAFMRGVIKDAGAIMQDTLTSRTQSLGDLFAQRASSMCGNLSLPELAMRLDLAYTLPDDYLQKVDVGSMAFSLEARDPLLDHTIIEWAARLPLKWKIRNGTNKYLLRKLAYRYVPREILDRKKMGFSVPMAEWLRTGLKPWGETLLSDSEAFEALELNATAVRSLWSAHQTRQVQAHTALWSVLVLLQFYRSQLD